MLLGVIKGLEKRIAGEFASVHQEFAVQRECEYYLLMRERVCVGRVCGCALGVRACASGICTSTSMCESIFERESVAGEFVECAQ